jgi:hypothetical protein
MLHFTWQTVIPTVKPKIFAIDSAEPFDPELTTEGLVAD